MPIYAQLQGDICFAITETSGPLVGPEFIQVPELDASLLGRRHVGEGIFELVPVPEVRRISVGAFYDRFGAAKWGILADTVPTVRAVVEDAKVRQFIDLDNPQLPAGLAILEAAGHEIDVEAIRSAPVQAHERP